ncbi:MAG: hypothetical protein WCK76_10255 [Elusimicrobiota bacterium]
MTKITLARGIELLKALGVPAFGILLCFAGPGYGQTAFSQLGGYEAQPVPEAPAPARAERGSGFSFTQAEARILSAKKSVYLTTLALPGDEAGRRMAKLLITRRRAGLDVRLSVDGTEAEAFRPLFKELSAQGIQVRVFRLSYCSSLVPYSRLLLIDGKYISLEDGSETANNFILPQQQGSGLDDAIVFFFTANDDGSKPKILSACHGAAQGSALDDSIVFFFTANDGSSPK